MFAKHPLDQVREKLTGLSVADALRLAIIAELDAISTYLQIAEAVEDEDVKKVFIDVAGEEKEHVGEFLTLLHRYDPELAKKIEEGRLEVEEITGRKQAQATGEAGGKGNPEEPVAKLFLEQLERRRLLARELPVTRVGPGVDYVMETRFSGSSVHEHPVSVATLQVEFTIPGSAVERAKLLGEPIAAPLVADAAGRLASMEDKIILNSILNEDSHASVESGTWKEPGNAIEAVAEAVAAVEEVGARPPYLLVLPTGLYTSLLRVSDETGQTALEVVKQLAKPLRHPQLQGDTAVLVPVDPNVADVVIVGEPRVAELGLEPEGYRFLATERMAFRIHHPAQIAIIKVAGEKKG